jgi:catechol-2,3-dioxygenase
MIEFIGMDHVGFTVSDMERAIAWYGQVLGMQRRFADAWTHERDPVVLCNGSACVALFRNLEGIGLSSDADHYNRHFAFGANRENFERIQARLRELGIEFVFRDHHICHSIYFWDPDCQQIEVVTYEIA